MQKQYLRPQEVADMLGLSRWSIYNLLRAGKLPGYRFAHSWRISVEDANKWVAEQSNKNRKRKDNARA